MKQSVTIVGRVSTRRSAHVGLKSDLQGLAQAVVQ